MVISLAHNLLQLIIINSLHETTGGRRGRLVLSALISVLSSPSSSPAGDFVLTCSWAKHLTLTVSLSTQEHTWVPKNCWGNLTNFRGVTFNGLASCPGGVEILLATWCYRSSGSYEPVGSKTSLFFLIQSLNLKSIILNLPFILNHSFLKGNVKAIYVFHVLCHDMTWHDTLHRLTVRYSSLNGMPATFHHCSQNVLTLFKFWMKRAITRGRCHGQECDNTLTPAWASDPGR